MTIAGCLIGESLRVGCSVDGVTLTVEKISRAGVGDVDSGQPRRWTLIEFEASDADAERLARTLEQVLEPTGGWYCDFRTEDETFVVFAGRTFRYSRGDSVGRAAAEAYGRSVGVPEPQLDWPV